ncbi:MAG: cytochrome c biogenesis protein CcsA, partial [Rhizobacter sp.]|nr:cytochrome c biogenesis protein CcsA [Chlorobiales bacterium]
MTVILHIFTFLVPLFYFASAMLYAATFFGNVEDAKTFRRPALATAVTLHLIYLALHTALTGRLPIANVYEITTLIAFTLALVYLFIEWRTGVGETGFFVITVAFLFQVYSSLFIAAESAAPAALLAPVLQLHIVAALLGYSAITIAGIYSLLYILLQRDIESNRFSVLFERLP